MRNDVDHSAIQKIPAWMWAVGILFVVISWLPLALIARSRTVKSPNPPVHLFLDMDFQPRYGPQDAMAWMNDERAMREPVPGTVRYDSVIDGVDPDDDHFFRGYETDGNLNPIMIEVETAGVKTKENKYLSGFPDELTVDRALIERGRDRFNIYCAVCHGRGGYGDGPVYDRIKMRMAWDSAAVQGFPEPRNFHQADMLDLPEGKIFDRITRGVFTEAPDGKKTYTMWPYASQLSPRDRWAVVAWVKVMQRGQYFPANQAPNSIRSKLESAPTVQHPAVPVKEERE